MALSILYESAGFPQGGRVRNRTATLKVTWDDLLWSAVTIGRRNMGHVFAHGHASIYEALFRWSLLRMAVEQSGRHVHRLRRTEAAKSLDPTEKGAVNYFVGMVVCKLFVAKLLDAPWALHLDIYRDEVDAVVRGRSRPDLIAEVIGSGHWIAIEAKGRARSPNEEAKEMAKEQAKRVETVGGVAPVCHVGCVTYYDNDILRYCWIDPVPDDVGHPDSLRLPAPPADALRYHYGLALSVVKALKEPTVADFTLDAIRAADLEVKVHPSVSPLLLAGKWDIAKKEIVAMQAQFEADGYQPDGLMVKAGNSWSLPYEKHTL